MRRLRTWLATAGLIAVLISIGTLLYAAATYTTNLTLTKMTRGTTEWDTVINANYDIIDSVIGDYRQKGFTSLSSWINNVYDEVHAARGTKPSLDARLDWALNEDGTLKGTASVSEWINSGHSATRVDSDTFRISGGDYTGTYTPGRRLNLYDGSNHYMTVVSSTYTSGKTNVDVDDTVPTTILRLDYSVLADNSAPRKITGDFEVTGTLRVATQISTSLLEGVYQELPGIILWLDPTSPPDFAEYTIPPDGPTTQCLLFDKDTDEKVHLFFDVPKDWKTTTPIVLVIKGAGTTAASGDAHFGFRYKCQAIGSALSWSGATDATAVSLSGMNAAYRSGSFMLSSTTLSAGGSVVGTLYRDADNVTNDTYAYDFRVLSITGYYQKRNN